MNLTIKVSAKICLWYKALIKIVAFFTHIGIMPKETAIKIICETSGKGFAYRVGKSKWRRLNRNLHCEIT